jgi:hypothetical protein
MVGTAMNDEINEQLSALMDGELAVEEAQGLERAAVGVRILRPRGERRRGELAVGVDRVAGDHQVAVAQPAEHRVVAERVAGQ